jgi:hypothetical protein
MPHLEPTYLRYIYDGLIKGSIHPENAAELPEGLIGLYEEAFDERQPVHKRQQLLERFAIWALLKKEVTAQFVAEVLNQPLEEIQEFIATYSAWFNSPESGKYQLYHERIKVYLLQKLSEFEVHALHEKLISRLEQAIANQKADEFEWYGLEFLTQHYAINAMLNGDGSKLLALAYNQYHWQRQLKISKGYNWTKVGLHSVMSWASKHNDDEVIECGLQLVDLHNQEQNAAPQIVSLVAEGDFDSALKRIEQFGGNDKEGLQRKFILYMLCLIELNKLMFSQYETQKFTKQLLDAIKSSDYFSDINLFDWTTCFPEIIIYELVIQWNKLNLDGCFLFSMTQKLDEDWIYDISLKGDRKRILNIIKDKELKKVNIEALKNQITKLSEYLLESKIASETILNEELELKFGVNSPSKLQKLYPTNDISSEIKKICDSLYLLPFIHQLSVGNPIKDNSYLIETFLLDFNKLSKHYRLLNLNRLASILSKNNWEEINEILSRINLDDSDILHSQSNYNKNLKNKLLKYILFWKWLKQDSDFTNFTCYSLNEFAKNEQPENFTTQMFGDYNMLKLIIRNQSLFENALNLSSKFELSFNLGFVAAENYDLDLFKDALKKIELIEFKEYVIKGFCLKLEGRYYKDLKELTFLLKDFPKYLNKINTK